MESTEYQPTSPCRTSKGLFKKHTNVMNSFIIKEREPPAFLHNILSSSHLWVPVTEALRDDWIIAQNSRRFQLNPKKEIILLST